MKIRKKIALILSIATIFCNSLLASNQVEYDTIGERGALRCIGDLKYTQGTVNDGGNDIKLSGLDNVTEATTDSSLKVTTGASIRMNRNTTIKIDSCSESVVEKEKRVPYAKSLAKSKAAQASNNAVDVCIEDVVGKFDNGREYFLTGSDAKISFIISNNGTTDLTGVSLGVFIDGKCVGVVLTKTLGAHTTKSYDLLLSGIKEGNHVVTGWIDCYKEISESNEENNILSTKCLWLTSDSQYAPDLTGEIFMVPADKPEGTNAHDISDEEKITPDTILASQVVWYKFRIKNIGYAPCNTTTWAKITMEDGEYTTYMRVAPKENLDVGGYVEGICEYSFNNGSDGSDGIVKIEVDDEHAINEVNENNNFSSCSTKVSYPSNYTDYVGRAGVYGGDVIDTNDNYPTWRKNANGRTKVHPSVQVYSSASGKISKDVFDSGCNKWNNISSNLEIGQPQFIGNDNYYDGSGDIRIIERDLGNYVYGVTSMVNPSDTDNRSFNLITLNSTALNSSSESDDENDRAVVIYEQKLRTMTHEMGHALGLSHPHWGNDISNPYQYSKFSSIMWQSLFPESYAVFFISYRDKFAIMSLYGQ